MFSSVNRVNKSFNFENESSIFNKCFLNWVIYILKSKPQDQALTVLDDIILNIIHKRKNMFYICILI